MTGRQDQDKDTQKAGAGPEPGTPAAAPAPVTHAECEALLDHVMTLAYAEHTAKVAPEYAPTGDDVAKIRAELAPTFIPACTALSRSTYECELGAKTREELLTCSPKSP